MTGWSDQRPYWALWTPPETLAGPPRLQDIQTIPSMSVPNQARPLHESLRCLLAMPHESVALDELAKFLDVAQWYQKQQEGQTIERGYVQHVGQTPGQTYSGYMGSGGGGSTGSLGSYGSQPFKLLKDLTAPNGLTDCFNCVVEVCQPCIGSV